MTIDELISLLEQFKHRYGNLDVTCRMPLPNVNPMLRPKFSGNHHLSVQILVLNNPEGATEDGR